MSVIDSAILRLQELAIAASSSDVTIKYAPDYPVDDATVLPLSIAHVISGQATAVSKTDLQLEPVVAVDFHHNRTSLKQAYKEIDAVILNFTKLLAGDPSLNDTIDTIQFPVTYEVVPAEWDRVVTQMCRFTIPFKTLETPATT